MEASKFFVMRFNERFQDMNMKQMVIALIDVKYNVNFPLLNSVLILIF